jgi:hypothetical protein
MRTKAATLVTIMMASAVVGLAGDFLNLNFELARTNSLQIDPNFPMLAGQGPTTDLLPGWDVSSGGITFDVVTFNIIAECCASIASVSAMSREAEAFYPHVFTPPPWITGNYFIWVSTAKNPLLMSQVGDIPPEATELKLYTRRDSGTYLKTYLNDTEIVNGDISAFSGMGNVKLTLEFGEGFFSGFTSPYAGVDRIEMVPEPSTWCCGSLLEAWPSPRQNATKESLQRCFVVSI